MKGILVLCLCVLIIGHAARSATEEVTQGITAESVCGSRPLPWRTLFASPNGSGTTCSQSSPCSLAGVVAKVCGLRSNMTGDILVSLRGGTYRLTSPLTLGPDDSGTNGFYVIYRAFGSEKPMLSGGWLVTNWTEEPQTGIWRANVPSGTTSRQFYVNGMRAQRASSSTATLGARMDLRDANGKLVGYEFESPAIAHWANVSDVEFVYTASQEGTNRKLTPWTDSRCGVASATEVGGKARVVMKSACFDVRRSMDFDRLDNPSTVENNAALLDQAGEWYLDSSASRVLYIPRILRGEDMTTANAVLAVSEHLLILKGSSSAKIKNLRFEGLTFAEATWRGPSTDAGFVEMQANATVSGGGQDSIDSWAQAPASVQVIAGRSICLQRNTFTRLGAQGLALTGGTQDSVVRGNYFTDISGTGLRVADVSVNVRTNTDPDRQDRNIIIDNNSIYDVATEFRGGTGIFVGYASAVTISHNEIANVPYTGISIGWGWGFPERAPALANGGHVVTYNKIHDIKSHLPDGGGIYALDRQDGSRMDHNWVFNDPFPYGSLYLDNGSTGWTVEQNVVSNTSTNWLFEQDGDPKATGNVIGTNYADTARCRAAEDATCQNGVNQAQIVNGAWPTPARDIMALAGVEPAYRAITGGPLPQNLAVGQPSFASSVFSEDHPVSGGNDGVTFSPDFPRRGWSPASANGIHWWEVDLGRSTPIRQIQIQSRRDMDEDMLIQLDARRNFEVWASNTTDMSIEHVVLGAQGFDPFGYRDTWILRITDPSPYRYVAVVKVVPEYLFLEEVRVFGSPLTGEHIGDIDGDGDVDRDDLEILLQDRGKSVSQSACGARCDLNGDGQITGLDVRELIELCSRPNCATQ
jgi:hypothetical protein